ncbi:MAG: PadR family transcriptional regulator, partial [Propionibacteriaceae bacterium]|nr:PadR family transcriptional regulator [Propionibacteriaceae bacterium]
QSILVLLTEEPRNGYQIITALNERTYGAWQPSPGAVYPCLQQLTDEGLAEPVDLDGQKSYQLTEAGRAAAEELPPEPWAAKRDPDREAAAADPESVSELKNVVDEIRQLDKALRLLAGDASPEQLRTIAGEISTLRRRIYATLAEGPQTQAD